jgi:hypothetical protein
MSYTKIVQVGVSSCLPEPTLERYPEWLRFTLQASGNVGTPVLEALIAAGKFEITVVARDSSSFTPPNASGEYLFISRLHTNFV